MKIAMLSAASSIHTARWANALCARGHEVTLFSLSRHPPKPGAYDGRVRISLLGRGGALDYWTAAGQLRRLLSGCSPDVLNAHYATGYGTLARRTGFHPLFLSVWGSDVYDFPALGPFHRRLVQQNLAAADAVGSTSRAMAGRVRRLWRREVPLYLTPFGVNPAQFCPLPGQRPPENRFTVGAVRALEPKYGLDVLLHAFALMRARLRRENAFPEGGVRLEIAGAGSRLEPLQKLAQRLEIAPDVVFDGAVPHHRVPELLRGLDVFCAPSVSDSESFGVAAVEAMACGVPVAVSDADGLKEVTLDGVTGFVVPKRDPVLLANRLVTLARDPSLRRRMGQAGRAHVLRCYAWSDCVRRMEDALTETVLHERRARRIQ